MWASVKWKNDEMKRGEIENEWYIVNLKCLQNVNLIKDMSNQVTNKDIGLPSSIKMNESGVDACKR